MDTNKDKPITTKKGLKCMLKLYFSRSKSSVVSLMLITAYLLWFVMGILFGGGFTNAIDMETATISGMIATASVFILGSYVIYQSMFRHHPIIILSVLSMMGANIAYTLGLFQVPVVDFLFDIATIVTMSVLYCIVNSKNCLHIGSRK